MPTAARALFEQYLSPQWCGVLQALAAEFSAQLNRDELRQMMFKVGVRFATARPITASASIAELADAINTCWAAMQWGQVHIADESNHLSITHYGAPLRAFGADAMTWAPAFLQGCYQSWLDAMGAVQLEVVEAGVHDEGFTVEFHLVSATN